MTQVTFYGAAQTVTGSQHMIEVNGMRLLLDCGLYQGKRAEAYERNRHLPFDASKVDVSFYRTPTPTIPLIFPTSLKVVSKAILFVPMLHAIYAGLCC